ncbi:succinate dehydrogenase assembly factor 2 [Pelagibacteraceae bacterium]|nr:succinate dehydrogenase assembly factor 2 [Pelagibacteraceae bacterium]
MKNLENLKKKIIYRSAYRGTKEMDLLLSSFVKQYINKLSNIDLLELEKFLKIEDNVINDFYFNNIITDDIKNNPISNMLKNFKY